MATEINNISPALIWECTRKTNSFMVKRNGVQFSSDPMNLTNVHSFKNSGFLNSRAIGVTSGPKHSVVFSTKTSKANKPSKGTHSQSFTGGHPSRSIYRSVVKSTAKRGYRADLRDALVARISAIKKSQRPVKERKEKLRGNKKTPVASHTKKTKKVASAVKKE